MSLKQTSSLVDASAQGFARADLQPQQSQLLANLLEPALLGQRLRVFDVGAGRPETVNFFAETPCHLHFADLFDDLPFQQPGEELTELEKEQQLLEQFQQRLALPAGSCFDLCLFWDLFNYFDSTALRAFSQAIQPYLHSKTSGHGFVQREARKVPPSYRYGIHSENTFSTQLLQRDLTRYCHAQAAVDRALSGFEIRRGVLMLDGRLEFLLASTLSKA